MHQAIPVTFLDGSLRWYWMDPCVVDAVLWLARAWQLLFIDIRPPNLRVSDEGEGQQRIQLVDYDDMVLLQDHPCCDKCTVGLMRRNEHVIKVFNQYRKLAELFDEASAAAVCDICAAL